MIVLYALWCGFCWVLRGGAFGALCRRFGYEPGTTVTRIASALLMSAPLLYWHPALWPSIYLAMTIGYFGEAMSVNDWRERGLMAAWGFYVLTAALFGVLDVKALVFAPVGALASVAYISSKAIGGRLPFDWTQRAEAATGAIFGAALWGAAWL